MLYKIRLKSFGLTESVVASVIIIIVLSAAIALSSNTIKTTEANASYTEAQHLSENFFESINLIKSSGQIYFDNLSRGDQVIKIECFDSNYYKAHLAECKTGIDSSKYPLDQLPYLKTPTYSNGYYLVPASLLDNPAFGNNYFSYKITVIKPDECYTSGQITISKIKCRRVLTDIKWEETSGEKHYRQGMYLTDWER